MSFSILFWALLLSVGLPLLLACMLCSVRARPWIMQLSVIAPLPALFSSLFAIGLDAPTIVIDLKWMLMGSHLMLDDTGQVFLLLTAIVWLASALYAVSDSQNIEHRLRFYGCFLLAMAGNIGVTLAGDLATFYTCFALMSFAAYGVIVTNDASDVVRAGRVYITLVVIGEVVLFSAFVAGAQASGSSSITQWQSMAPAAVTVPLVVLAFGIKLGAIPWHFVLPVTYRVTPDSAAVALGGAMLNAGLLGWFRFLPLGQMALPDWGSLLVIMGLLASFFGVLLGLMQLSPKALLGYSSVSQMGLMTSVVGLALIDHTQWGIFSTVLLIYALHHALAKGALFYAAGFKQAHSHLSYYWQCFALVLPALTIAGAPLTTGALAKSAFKAAVGIAPEPWSMWFVFLLPLSSIATSLLMIRFVQLVWPVRAEATNRAILAFAGQAVLTISVAICAWLFAGVQGVDALSAAMTFTNLWASTWPIMVATVLFVGFAWILKKSRRSLIWIPAGDILLPIEAMIKYLLKWLAQLATTIGHAYQQGIGNLSMFSNSYSLQTAENMLRKPLSVGILFTALFIGLLLALGFALIFIRTTL